MIKKIPKLTLVTNYPTYKGQTIKDYIRWLATITTYGIDCIQLRQKNMSKKQLVYFGKQILKHVIIPSYQSSISNNSSIASEHLSETSSQQTTPSSIQSTLTTPILDKSALTEPVLLIVNDHIDVCLAIKHTIKVHSNSISNSIYQSIYNSISNSISSSQNLNNPTSQNSIVSITFQAHGVHLGQSDGNILEARKMLGPNKIIGLSTNTLEEIDHSNTLPIDYIGVGSIFPTANKKDVTTIWQLSGLQQAVKQAKHPIIAIGGINHTNSQAVLSTGIHGIACIGAFHSITHFPSNKNYDTHTDHDSSNDPIYINSIFKSFTSI